MLRFILNAVPWKEFVTIWSAWIKRERISTPPRNLENGIFYNQVIDACYDLTEKGLEVEWQYPFCKFKEETMKEFSELFIKYCDILAQHWNDENEIDVINLIK